MEKMEIIDGESLNSVDENIERLRDVFPESFAEDGISFEILRQLLGEHFCDPNEKYDLNWHGKNKSLRIALTPTTGTLRPCPSENESEDWHGTQNLFIEGENMMALKLMQRSYAGKIKLIYIDPPYNTDGDFVYSDNFQDDLGTYLKMTGQLDDNGHKKSSRTEANGKKHTKWLNMMYPRLKLARELLSENGVLICHIDEHEYTNLNYLLDWVFGQKNDLGPVIWDKKNPKGDAKGIATQHEYVAIYAKNAQSLIESNPIIRPKPNAERILKKAASIFAKKGKKVIPDELAHVVKKYDLPIDIGKYEVEFDSKMINAVFCLWISSHALFGREAANKRIDCEGKKNNATPMVWPHKSSVPDYYFVSLIHPVTGNECFVPEKGIRNPPSTMKRRLDSNHVLFGEDESKQPERKYFHAENMEENVLYILPFLDSDDEISNELDIPFEHPRPVAFVKELLSCFLLDGDIVLDFFAGSGTTAHAVMQLCAEQNKNIRYAMVQMPEPINPKMKKATEFCKQIGRPPNVAEISKERIRRSASKIKTEFPDFDGDFGFKVFKLGSSNIRTWDPDPTDLSVSLFEHEVRWIDDRSEQDVMYEFLLKNGFDLATSLDEKKINGKNVCIVGNGELVFCLDVKITYEEVDALAKAMNDWLGKNYSKSETTAVFRDSAFADEVAKIHMTTQLGLHGISRVKCI